MNGYTPSRRAALLLQTGPGEQDVHLFFVLTDPFGEPPSVLLANATSIRQNVPYDATCVGDRADHAWLTHPSFIAYRFAVVMLASRVTAGVRSGAMQPMGPISEDTCARICAGVLASPASTPRCKAFYQSTIAPRPAPAV